MRAKGDSSVWYRNFREGMKKHLLCSNGEDLFKWCLNPTGGKLWFCGT